MATISTIAMNLIARTGKFERGMHRSKRTVHGFGTAVTNVQRRITGLAKGLVGLAVAGGLAYMVKSTMANIDATAKLSDRLGIATEKLIGLRHAATIYGSSAEQLDKALGIMVRRLGEVMLGSGEASYGLKLLGLQAAELVAKSPDESFRIIADRLKKLKTASDKSAAAYYLFGRQGMQLVNTLNLGSEGLERMQKEAERLGITFDRVDAAKVEAANDSLTKVKGMLRGIAQVATIQLSPIIETVADKFTGIGTSSIDMGDAVVSSFEKMSLAAGIVNKALSVVKATVQLIGVGMQAVVLGILKSLDVVMDIAQKLNDLVAKTFVGRKLGWQKQGAFTGLDKEINFWIKEMEKTASALGQSMKVVFTESKTRAYFEKLRAESAQLRANLEKQAEAVRKAAQAGEGFHAFLSASEKIEKVNTRLKEQIDLFGLTTRAAQLVKLEKLGEGLTPENLVLFNAELEKTKQLMDKLGALEIKMSLEKSAEQIWKATRTPLEKYESEIGKLGKLFDTMIPTGKLDELGREIKKRALDFETYSRAIRMVKDEFERATKAAAGMEATKMTADFREIRTALINVSGLVGTQQIENRQLTELRNIATSEAKSEKHLQRIVEKEGFD